MKIKELLEIVNPYCEKIVHNNKHYKCYLKDKKNIVVIASTSSDKNYARQVYRDFRRYGFLIKEFNY